MKKQKIEMEIAILEAEELRKLQSYEKEEARKEALYKIKCEIITQFRGLNLFENYYSISFTF